MLNKKSVDDIQDVYKRQTVNGENMGSTRELKDKDIIQLLGYQLIYSSTCIYYLSEREGIYLKVCDVNKYVGRGNKKKQILHQVDCEIRGNEFVAIIGGSGAGKSTLMLSPSSLAVLNTSFCIIMALRCSS